MKFPLRLLALCAALAVTALPAAARPPVPVSHPAPGHRLQFDPHKFMRVSDLRPGMRGYALTVFQGTKIQRFGVEILGVIKKYNEGKDYILFRATSGPPVTENLNIAHGMSGSPIYIGGKLVGAISMEVSNGTQGPSFPRDPIGLATPIEEMFDAWSPDLPAKPESMSAGPLTGGSGGYAAAGFAPISMPVSVSGVTPDGIARLGAALAPYHFALSAGGGGGGKIAKNLLTAGKALQPGAAVGVSLMQGDMDFTATGTVTYRDGNRVLLFGHPFFNLGPIDAALTTASVVGIYPSYEDSVKLGQPLETVGRIFQDRPFSVGGIVGSLPQMIPMTVSVNDLSIRRQKTFHVRIINHPLLTGQFVPMVAQQAIEQVHGLPGDSMATVTMDADVEEIGHVRRTNTFYDAVNIDQAASADITSLMQTLQSNPFYPLSLKSVRMSVTIRDGHDTAEVDHIFLRQSKFHPGDDIPIGVVLKPYKRALVTEYLHVRIPQNTPDGSLSLNVSGGADSAGGSISLGGLILITSSAPSEPAATISQLVKQLEDKPRNNSVVADLTLPTSALVIHGDKLTNLPPTLEGVIRSTHSTGIQTERDEVKVTQAMPYIVSGSQTLTITVQKQDSVEAPGSDSGHSPTPTPETGASEPSPEGAGASPVLALPTTPAMALSPRRIALAAAPADAAETAAPASFRQSTESDHAPTPVSAPDRTPTVPGNAAPVKAVGRPPTVWRQDTLSDFQAGTLQNVSVSSAGDVRLAAGLQKVADTPETYIWAIQPDGHGSAYLATGDRGIIDKMTADGKVTPFFKTGQLEATCLALDTDGNVYAGTAPHGIVYKIPPDGKGVRFCATQEKYVTALAVLPSRKLVIATGGGTGRVYEADLNSGLPSMAAVLFTSPEAHILSLATDQKGDIYAGSSPDGIVYKITPDGRHQVLYAASEPNIAALATDSEGNVYAGTTPQGSVFKIAPDGTAKQVLEHASSGVLSLRTDDADNVYACAGNTIYRIAPDETTQSYAAESDEQFLSLGIASDAVYAGTGTVGVVYALGGSAAATQGRFVSEVHDAEQPSRWGTLSWTADTPPGTQVALETRSGDVPTPDASWSAWSPPSDAPAGQTITSPPGRYLQYRALLTRDPGTAASAAPRLRSVTVYYLTRNRPPTITLVSPSDGDALHQATLLHWAAADPDGDTLAYTLSYSRDGGKTWTPITQRATPSGPGALPHTSDAAPAPADAPKPVTDAEINASVAQAVAAMDRKYPNMPPTVRAQIAAQAGAAIRSSMEAERSSAASSSDAAYGGEVSDTSFSWDTASVPDGTYQIQVIASDKPSNPVGWLTAKAVSQPFLIVNTPPTLTLGTAVVNSDKTVTVRGVAQAKLAFIRAVQGHADSADDVAALAENGLFDSPLEPFTLTVGPLTPGPHTITVEALDQADNPATGTVSVTLPGQAAASPPAVTAPLTRAKTGHGGKNHEPPGPAHAGMTWLYDSAIRQWVQVETSLLPASLPPLPSKAASKGHVWIYDTQISQWVEGI